MNYPGGGVESVGDQRQESITTKRMDVWQFKIWAVTLGQCAIVWGWSISHVPSTATDIRRQLAVWFSYWALALALHPSHHLRLFYTRRFLQKVVGPSFRLLVLPCLPRVIIELVKFQLRRWSPEFVFDRRYPGRPQWLQFQCESRPDLLQRGLFCRSEGIPENQ